MELTKDAPTGLPTLRVRLRRLRRSHLVLAAAGGLLIAYAALGLTLLHQSQSLAAVQADSAVSQRALRNSANLVPAEELQQMLSQAEAQLTMAQAAIPKRVQPTAFVAALLQLAEATNVKVVKLQNLKVTEKTIGQHVYGVMPFVVTLQGATPNSVLFVSHLERMGGQTLVVRSAKLTEAPDGTDLLIELDIYTQSSQDPPEAAPQNTTKPQAKPTGK